MLCSEPLLGVPGSLLQNLLAATPPSPIIVFPLLTDTPSLLAPLLLLTQSLLSLRRLPLLIPMPLIESPAVHRSPSYAARLLERVGLHQIHQERLVAVWVSGQLAGRTRCRPVRNSAR